MWLHFWTIFNFYQRIFFPYLKGCHPNCSRCVISFASHSNDNPHNWHRCGIYYLGWGMPSALWKHMVQCSAVHCSALPSPNKALYNSLLCNSLHSVQNILPYTVCNAYPTVQYAGCVHYCLCARCSTQAQIAHICHQLAALAYFFSCWWEIFHWERKADSFGQTQRSISYCWFRIPA